MPLTDEQAAEIAQLAQQAFQDALEAEKDAQAKVAAAKAQRDAEDKSLIEETTKKVAAQFAKANRLPDRRPSGITPGHAPHVTQFADTRKYDGLGVEDMAFVCGVLDAAIRDGKSRDGVSDSALKALAIKIAEDKGKLGEQARNDLKAAGINPQDVVDSAKANELNYSTQAGYGDEWVGVEYSRRLWENIRFNAPVTSRIPSVEIPQGMESIVIPIEAGDPTWYKVSQATANNATTGIPDATVTASKAGTDNDTLSVGKMGARVVYAEELNEDSLIPWAAQLRMKLEKSGGENLEALVIDGDTATGATTNINDIGGTPAGTELFLILNGFRKLPLVTNTANSRSASGSLSDDDFLQTAKLMGVGGLNATDRRAVSFLVDANVSWKLMQLASVKTRDVFTNATIENGMLTGIFGYEIVSAPFMQAATGPATYHRKVNTAGKVDLDTDGNNTTGAILMVRWDQWLLGFKRRMTFKIQDIIGSDASQIVATARVGLVYRDTDAASISYNVGI